MIAFLCPSPTEPSGGVWFIHRLVHLLNESGILARVLMLGPRGPGVWWDIHPIPPHEVIDSPPFDFQSGDTLVIPETMYHEFPLLSLDHFRTVVFIQNYIWLNREYYRAHPAPVMVCSRYLANWVQRELCRIPIGIVRPFLHKLLWRPTTKTPNRVMILARRNYGMAASLATAIEDDGFPVDFVDEPLTQWQLYERFAEAEYYVHHVEPEGFPMVCLEAMRSGTIVVGTTGGGGNEFMHNDETALVTPGPKLGLYTDPEIFVDKVLARLRRLRDDPDLRSKLVTQAETWSWRYTPEATLAELKGAMAC